MNVRMRRKGMLWILLVLALSAWALPSWAGQARNVILMIGDGMGPAHVELAWLYATRQLHRPLVMTEVMDAGKTAYMVNDTADTTVTESAAAGDPDGDGSEGDGQGHRHGAPTAKSSRPSWKWPGRRGKATGLVTTSGDHRRHARGFCGPRGSPLQRRGHRRATSSNRTSTSSSAAADREFFLPDGGEGKTEGRQELNRRGEEGRLYRRSNRRGDGPGRGDEAPGSFQTAKTCFSRSTAGGAVSPLLPT